MRRRARAASLLLAVALAASAAVVASQRARPGGVPLAKSVTVSVPRPAPRVPDPLLSGVTRVGAKLLLDGRPWRFTGVNDFGAATDYAVNYGCGSPTADLDGLFASLRPHSVVRFWAFQAMAWNNKATPQHLDFTGIDAVVRVAERHHQLLILTLSDQAGTCDDGAWHDPAWYDGGYAVRRNDDGRGLSGMSYLAYVATVVARYRDSPAIGFWEPVNEPEASTCTGATGGGCFDSSKRTCPADAAATLRSFFDTIGPVIRGIDPRHLISTGVAGGNQCGLAGSDSSIVAASPYVDLMTFHDYGDPADATSGGLGDRLLEDHDAAKPLAVEEAGISGGSSAGCLPPSTRAADFAAKLDEAFARGAAGYLPWWFSQSPGACGQDFGPGDPLLAVLRAAPQ